MKKELATGALALAVLGGGAATVAAHSPTPTVMVGIKGSQVTVQGAEALPSGQTRVTFRNDARAPRFVGLFEAKKGLTTAQVNKALTTEGPPSTIARSGRIMLTGQTAPGTPLTSTMKLRDRDYYVVDLTERPALRGKFTPGSQLSTAHAPAYSARVSLRDFRITGHTTLPAEGVVRIDNRGKQFHELVAFPLRKGVTRKQALRAARSGPGDKLPVAGPPVSFLGPVSPGTSNVLEIKAKPGRYLALCHMPDERSHHGKEHRKLGMARIITLR